MFDGKADFDTGNGRQGQQVDQAHKLVLCLGGGIGALAKHRAPHEPGGGQGGGDSGGLPAPQVHAAPLRPGFTFSTTATQ